MTFYRFFLDVIDAQEVWLNNLADKGYRLVEAKGCKYTFEDCKNDEFIYMVDVVAIPAEAIITEREQLLDSHKLRIMRNKMPLMGNTTFLICEKKNTEEPLEVSTNAKDAILCYKKIRTFALVFGIITLMLTILTLVTDLFINLPLIKLTLAFIVFWLIATVFKATQIIADYIARYKLS